MPLLLLRTASPLLELPPPLTSPSVGSDELAAAKQLLANESQSATAEKRSGGDCHPTGDKHINTRCHRKKETAITDPSAHALYILINHFQNHVRIISMEVTTGGEDDADGCNGDINTHVVNNDDQDSPTITSSPDWSLVQCYNNHCSNNIPNRKTIPTILLLLPPNATNNNHQYYSHTPSTSPTNPFALRLIHLENTHIRLTSLSAYISTLGGGFFLCKYLSTAIYLARQQCHIALLRGDTEMALKCRINEGYCYIHSGKLNKGKKVIRRVLCDVMRMQKEKGLLETEYGLLHHTEERELSELTVIRNMCHSALRFANLIREAGKSISLRDDGGGGGESSYHRNGDGKEQTQHRNVARNEKTVVSPTHDDFQRIRIVQDR
ncbi:hypothetical protein ACHAXR_001311, partial [Thalassiosira sp. AJA248-18]